MTWYGLGDLRDALGIPECGTGRGAILRALDAEDYDEVLVLCYDEPDKSKGGALLLNRNIGHLSSMSDEEKSSFVLDYANTELAHGLLMRRLQTAMVEAGKKVLIRKKTVDLVDINDTEGIYAAAVESIKELVEREKKVQISLHLSPGTPVMAFVWAFATLRFAECDIRLITTSRKNMPPSEVNLPREWLRWHGARVQGTTERDSKKYDIVFHLFGDRRVPTLLASMALDAKTHCFASSMEYSAQCMEDFIPKGTFREIKINAYDPLDVRNKIMEVANEYPRDARIAFDMTVGTKLMFSGAQSACRLLNADSYYVNMDTSRLMNFDTYESTKLRRIKDVDTFLLLNGNHHFISDRGRWEDEPARLTKEREELTKVLWRHRENVNQIAKTAVTPMGGNVETTYSGDFYKIRKYKDGSMEIFIDDNVFRFKKFNDFRRYITGGWFEEWVYLKLKPLLDNNRIKDMRTGLKVSIKDENCKDGVFNCEKGLFYQEFDVIFTDGTRLYIIECKSGEVQSTDIMKAQTITSVFGGYGGRAVLAAAKKPNAEIVMDKRAEDSGNLYLFGGEDLERNLHKILDLPWKKRLK